MPRIEPPPAKKFYEQRAFEGYGLQYPDGHVIRLYEHVLKERLRQLEKPKLFDFGCWTGTHAAYFAGKGFQVDGADIVESAVRQAALSVPNGTFRLIDDSADLPGIFPAMYDVIFCNQVLYFLDQQTFARRLEEFRAMSAPGAILIATMMGRNCFYAKHSKGLLPNGLERIELSEPPRLAGKTSFVRFAESADDLVRMFSPCIPIQIGRYDCDLDLQHNSEHFIYVGALRA
jgi:SAM-dependent methyltransferase